MPLNTPTIKQKVILSCAAVSLIIAGMLAVIVYFMGFLETRIGVLEEVTKIEDHVQELRRCEKNLFLYSNVEFGHKAVFLVEGAQRLLKMNLKELELATSPSSTEKFGTDLSNYRQEVSRYLKLFEDKDNKALKPLENSIREIGSKLSDYVESMARHERTSIHTTMEVVRNIQIGQLVLFAVVMAGFWILVFKKIVTPLGVLEEHTAKIAQGSFEPIRNLPSDPEIRQILDSFNRMTEELRVRQGQLVRAQSFAALGTLVAGVAHEVNTPLSTTRLHGEVLLEELADLFPEDSTSKAFFHKKLSGIVREVDRALKIVHDLLAMSRHKGLQLRPLKLNVPVLKAAELLGTQIPSGVTLVVDIADDVKVYGDDQRLTTVFMNLISNAVTAIEGKGMVTVQSEPVDDDLVAVSVSDTGKGIGEEDLEKIFDPYFTTGERKKGKGLGLFVTHEIVAAHKGTISAESTVGKGTTFKLSLPARGDEE